MLVKWNNETVLELTDIQKEVICNDINRDQFEADMKRRLSFILQHKYEQCYARLEKEWMPKLRDRYKSLPTDADQIAALIFDQEDYKCKKMRDEESEEDN